VPISITWPTNGAPMGPGFSFRVLTDTPGVPAVGTFWRIRLEGEAGGPPLFGEWQFPTQGLPTLEHYLSTTGFVTGSDLIADPRYPQGSTIQMQVAITSGGSVVESTPLAVKIDYTSGSQRTLAEKMTAVSGGLTTEQALQLQTTTEAMAFAIGGGLLEGVTDLLGLVGKRLFNDVLIEPDRSGEGSLTRPGALGGVNAFGIQWQLVTVPAGFGIDEGAPDQTEIDFMQLSYMYDSDIGLVPSDSKYIRSISGRWNWGLSYPDAVDYFIMPGAVVRFWWIVIAPFSSSELAAVSPNPH